MCITVILDILFAFYKMTFLDNFEKKENICLFMLINYVIIKFMIMLPKFTFKSYIQVNSSKIIYDGCEIHDQ